MAPFPRRRTSMWPWIKRWRDWAMHDLWPMQRLGLRPQSLHHSYEKAGLTVHDQAIPWNAEAVLVEALLRLPGTVRSKADFHLRIPGREPAPAESLRRQENEEFHRVVFRLPPPGAAVTAEILFRSYLLGRIDLPFLAREEFVRNLRLQMPSFFVRLGDESVACQTFVSSQCKGVVVSGMLASPTSLAPLLDLDLEVEFRSARGATGHRLRARLCSSQLSGRQALVTVSPRRFPKGITSWTVNWLVAGQALATQKVKAISLRTFQNSLRISTTRYVVRASSGAITVARQVPPLEGLGGLGPCFLICSREAGMAGICPVRVHAQVAGAPPPLLLEQNVLVTDGLTVVAPGTLDAADLKQVNGFELLARGQSLGTLALSPAPTATFTAEGGFKPPQDFTWTAAAEEELSERLSRLLEGRDKK